MNLVSFDIETWGLHPGRTLQPWHVRDKESGILTIALANAATKKTVVGRYPTSGELKRYFALDKKTIFCGWNIKFDLAFLIAKGLLYPLQKYRYLDGMLLLKRMGYDFSTYALKPTLRRFQKHLKNVDVDYSQDIKFKTGDPHVVYSDEEIDRMAEYNSRDAEYTLKLITYLAKKAPKRILMQAIRESTASLQFADAWQRGILLDELELKKYSKKLNKKITYLEPLLTKVNLTPQIIASPQQLKDYLVDELKVTLTEKTENGNYSVSKDVLNKLYYATIGHQHQIVRLIREYKKLKTEIDKFVTSANECLVTGDKVYPEPMLSGTYTGRLTYSIYTNAMEVKKYKNGAVKNIKRKLRIGVPMHQIKKEGGIRKLFVAPKDHSIVELDFSNQEMRLIACVADETTMIDLFNDEKDLHAYTGAGIAGVNYDDFLAMKKSNPDFYNERRKLGKLTNLALQYRLSATGLYKQWHDTYGLVDKTEQDAYNARMTYLRLYSGIPSYWMSSPFKAQRCGFVESMGGRRCSLTRWDTLNRYRSSQTAINFPIQATGADQKILALYCLRDFMQRNGIQLAWDLHDGLFFYVPDCMMQVDLVLEMVEILNNLPYKKAWDWQPQVDFPVEAKIGKCWGKLKEINV